MTNRERLKAEFEAFEFREGWTSKPNFKRRGLDIPNRIIALEVWADGYLGISYHDKDAYIKMPSIQAAYDAANAIAAGRWAK